MPGYSGYGYFNIQGFLSYIHKGAGNQILEKFKQSMSESIELLGKKA